MNKFEQIKKQRADNTTLAQFMGYVVLKHGEPVPAGVAYIDTQVDSFLQYHMSWDWLIPVIDRIKGLRREYKHLQYDRMCIHLYSIVESELLDCDLKTTYLAVLKYVEHYNKNKKLLHELSK